MGTLGPARVRNTDPLGQGHHPQGGHKGPQRGLGGGGRCAYPELRPDLSCTPMAIEDGLPKRCTLHGSTSCLQPHPLPPHTPAGPHSLLLRTPAQAPYQGNQNARPSQMVTHLQPQKQRGPTTSALQESQAVAMEDVYVLSTSPTSTFVSLPQLPTAS